jgi:hypothetical protein
VTANLKRTVKGILETLLNEPPDFGANPSTVALKSRVNPLAHLMLELAVHSPNPSMQQNPTATVFRNLLELAMFHEEVEKQQFPKPHFKNLVPLQDQSESIQLQNEATSTSSPIESL